MNENNTALIYRINKLLEDILKANIILTQIQEVENAITASNALLTTIDTSLNNIEADIEEIRARDARKEWDSIPGNVITFTYYTGIAAGNPSGNTSNVQTAVYSNGLGTVYTKTYTYDAGDKVLTVTTT